MTRTQFRFCHFSRARYPKACGEEERVLPLSRVTKMNSRRSIRVDLPADKKLLCGLCSRWETWAPITKH